MHRIVIVTPAGRKRYLEILKKYILSDPNICEWQLWDNCRTQEDRSYLNLLAQEHDKVNVFRIENGDGTNSSVNHIYKHTNRPDTFYIKMDDDIVWVTDGLANGLYDIAVGEREAALWWSPLVINNAICSWLIKYHSGININPNLTAQAACPIGWGNPEFAMNLHDAFLNILDMNKIEVLHIPNMAVSLSRFSINCIGYFGEDVLRLGENFCPNDVDDEEWISAVLPSLLGKVGRVVGNLVVSHFAFYTQEQSLLSTGILSRYAKLSKQA